MRRRPLLAAPLVAGLPRAAWPAGGTSSALPLRELVFPQDHGAHPDHRTEWWYVTGAVQDSGRRTLGFQVTFFRSRVEGTQAMRSAFAARQLVFAHAALSDPAAPRQWHDQRMAREGHGLALAATGDTRLRLRDWSLERAAGGSYRTRVMADGFSLELTLSPTQPLLLQGRQGLSRKGPEPEQASYYYTQPQLAVSGRIGRGGTPQAVQGRAWLDHEWSQTVMHPEAVGWDWIGINLDDGSALTAFQLRRADGSALWAGGSFRTGGPAGLQTRIAEPADIAFTPRRHWTSPATGARYPVEWTVRSPAGLHTVRARMDAQELDSRASTGTVYWEGLSELLDASGRRVGTGYLEMTGYAAPLRL